MITWIIGMVVVALIAGGLARLLMPGDDDMSLGATLLLGFAGSLIGGFAGWLIFGADADDGAVQTAGIVGSVIGAFLLLALLRASRRSRSTHL